jgi:hypothetical protein
MTRLDRLIYAWPRDMCPLWRWLYRPHLVLSEERWDRVILVGGGDAIGSHDSPWCWRTWGSRLT